MKRRIGILTTIALVFMVLLPVSVHAATYSLSETDMSIDVDNSLWYVFTRDNIKDNSELKELGISYNTMYDILYTNEAYMDALLLYEDGGYVEFFVRKRPLDTGVVNLSNYEDKDVLDFAKALAKKQGAKTYSVYENQYKFAKLEYYDSNYNYYLCEFYTVVNKENYTFTFQKPSQYTDAEYAEIKKIVDSIRFDVDTSLKEEIPTSSAKDIITKTIGGGVIGGIVGAIIAFVNKKKKNEQKNTLE